MGKPIFRILGAVGIAVAAIWKYWVWSIDQIGRVMTALGFVASPDTLTKSVNTWFVAHPHLVNQYGPYGLLIIASGIFLTPNLQPIVARHVDAHRRPKDIEEATGWSVSLEIPSAIMGILGVGIENVITFQSFRFTNVALTRKRIIDLEIKIPLLREPDKPIFFRSEYDGKTQYQQTVERFPTRPESGRRLFLQYLKFPIELAPGEMVEGQISVAIPETALPLSGEQGRSLLMPEWLDMDGLEFTIIERISGRKMKMKLSGHFDAARGELKKRPTSKKPSRLEKWLLSISG